MRKWVAVPAVALALAGCGQGEDKVGQDGEALAADAAASDTSSQAGGTAALENLDCTAIKAQRGQGLDVAGVTMGMSVDQAYQKVACSDPALLVELTEPRADGYRSIKGEGNGQNFSVRLVGVPGQEQVVEINRAIRYPDGQEPAVEGVLKQLQDKYGAFTETGYGGGPSISYQMVQRADGSRVVGLQDPLMRGCPYEQPQACGLTVTTNIIRAETNPALARDFQVIMLDPQVVQRQTQIAQNSQRTTTQQRQSQEVEAAAGRAPSL